MQVDIKTTDIRPIRQTFSNVARRLGADKPASRYQEATLDMQPTTNFHYRPLWQPEYAIYDKDRTALVMADWYRFKDPRHYYYGAYTTTRARQQEGADKQFEFAEKRNLLASLDEDASASLAAVLVPLRHYEWGANMNNMYCCAYGYGTALTQACEFAGMDRLGIAQYLSRIGLLLDSNGVAILGTAKQSWMNDAVWQGMRRVVENMLVTKDWFELYVAQNLVFDGLLYPVIHREYVSRMGVRTGNVAGMLTEFISDWSDESTRWVDATIKTAVEESPANAALISGWVLAWQEEVIRALQPIAALALGAEAGSVLDGVCSAFDARLAKLGVRR